VYNYTTCTWTLSAKIVQVEIQNLFVNFVIANSIQVTIISIIALAFCSLFHFMSRTGDWCTLTNGNLLRVQFMLPPKFEHFAADVSQSNESCTRELRAYPRCTRELRPGPRSDTLSSATLIMFY